MHRRARERAPNASRKKFALEASGSSSLVAIDRASDSAPPVPIPSTKVSTGSLGAPQAWLSLRERTSSLEHVWPVPVVGVADAVLD